MTSKDSMLIFALALVALLTSAVHCRTVRVYQGNTGNNIFPETWNVPTTFSFWAKPLGVFLFGLCLLCLCCAYRIKYDEDGPSETPATPWTSRANHYMVRAKGRTDKRIYLKYENGLWIHGTHSTT